MIAVLLDQVTAYAAAVRSHLSDLSPEQVEDLTDGLEADLAEALEDAAGGGVAADEASVLDLTRRFGPAREYAAEMRAAAGLEAAVVTGRRRPVRDAMRATGEHWEATGVAFVDRLARVPGGTWLVETVPLLRPAWWLLRAWVWFVVAIFPVSVVFGLNVGQPFVPTGLVGWLVLLGMVVLSVEWGRGHLKDRRLPRTLLALAHAVAVVAVVPLLVAFIGQPTTQTIYVDGGYTEPPPTSDGVVVDGMRVSNLFVYDAQGNELHDVQVFDDRGRPVQTITPQGGGSQDAGDWALPGVAQAWTFAPSADVDGRDRWNVYPLRGAPVDDWTFTDDGLRELLAGRSLALPPSPFAKAPALRGATGGSEGVTAPTAAPSPDAVPSGPAETAPATPGDGASEAAAPAGEPIAPADPTVQGATG